MQDRTINNALTQVWRKREPGWEFAWGALMVRGVEIPPQILRAKRPPFVRRELTGLILEALRDGPKGIQEVVAHLNARRPDIAPAIIQKRASAMLSRMQVKGLVWREGRVWGLV